MGGLRFEPTDGPAQHFVTCPQWVRDAEKALAPLLPKPLLLTGRIPVQRWIGHAVSASSDCDPIAVLRHVPTGYEANEVIAGLGHSDRIAVWTWLSRNGTWRDVVWTQPLTLRWVHGDITTQPGNPTIHLDIFRRTSGIPKGD
jgi:hypothetical protein